MSWQSICFDALLRLCFKARIANKSFADAKRNMTTLLEWGASQVRTPETVAVTARRFGDVPCQLVAAASAKHSTAMLVYCHGGAFMSGSSRTHLDLAWRLSAASGLRVLLVDYRLTPEHCFPAPIEDLTRVYRALLEEGMAADQLALGGDSAGANVVLSTLLDFRAQSVPLPAACVYLSPWLDLTLSGATIRRNQRRDCVVPVDMLENAAAAYAAGHDRAAAGLSPLFGNLAGLPATMLHVGGGEVLREDAERLTELASAAGVNVVCRVWPGQAHGFPMLGAYIPEGRLAIEEIGEFLRERLLQQAQ